MSESRRTQLARRPDPDEVLERLLRWYQVHGRQLPWRAEGWGEWRLVVTEILLQQTPADRVAGFVTGFFRRYPTATHLAATQRRRLEEDLKPLGLQRRRASRLKLLAEWIDEHKELPEDRRGLMALPGIGPYVAAAVMATLRGQPIATVDVNMARFIERVFGPRSRADIRYDPHVNDTARKLALKAPSAKDFNWAVLDLSAFHCTARNPRCSDCPIRPCCPTGASRSKGT